MKQHLLQELKMIFINFLNLYLIMLLHGMNLVLLKYMLKWLTFNNSNELPPEQLCFTYDEFKQFIEVEEDIKW